MVDGRGARPGWHRGGAHATTSFQFVSGTDLDLIRTHFLEKAPLELDHSLI
jgi:hypothetical protein